MLLGVVEPVFAVSPPKHKRRMCRQCNDKRHSLQQLSMSAVDAVEDADGDCGGFGDGGDGAVYVVELEHLVQFNGRVELENGAEGYLGAVAVVFGCAVCESAGGGQVVVEGAVKPEITSMGIFLRRPAPAGM